MILLNTAFWKDKKKASIVKPLVFYLHFWIESPQGFPKQMFLLKTSCYLTSDISAGLLQCLPFGYNNDTLPFGYEVSFPLLLFVIVERDHSHVLSWL